MRKLVPVTLLVFSALALMGESCGPAAGLYPAYAVGAVVTDDSLVGDYLSVSAPPAKGKPRGFPPATLVRDDTAEGPSYLLDLNYNQRFRLFLFDLEGARFADLIVEELRTGGLFPHGFSLPLHMYFKLTRGADGAVSLDYLDANWVDAEIAGDPKLMPTIELPLLYGPEFSVTREIVLSGDTAALQRLLARGASVDEAWSMGLELTRKGAPALGFKLTTDEGERSRDASSTEASFSVTGSHIEYESSYYSGRDAGQPGRGPVTARGRVKDPVAIDALVRAFERTKPAKPAKPVPKTEYRSLKLCLSLPESKERCVERLPDDDSGADFKAIVALRDALRADVVMPPP